MPGLPKCTFVQTGPNFEPCPDQCFVVASSRLPACWQAFSAERSCTPSGDKLSFCNSKPCRRSVCQIGAFSCGLISSCLVCIVQKRYKRTKHCRFSAIPKVLCFCVPSRRKKVGIEGSANSGCLRRNIPQTRLAHGK